MNPILRNILAVVAGIIIGGLVNQGIIMVSGYMIPPPTGVDNTDIESIKAGIHLFKPIHFLMPFLAHALGTLIGAFAATKIAVSSHLMLAMIVGGVFLLGGISAVMMIPAPMWFNVLDLAMAYIPMAYLGYKLNQR